MFQTVAVLDFGSQYTGLIVRRLRELRVHSMLFTGTIDVETLRREKNLTAIVLSGSPHSVYDAGAPKCDPAVFELGIPVLGICYGAQLMALSLGGGVGPSGVREYGRAVAEVNGESPLTNGLPKKFDVWMSHGDRVTELPKGCSGILSTEDCPHAGRRILDKLRQAIVGTK